MALACRKARIDAPGTLHHIIVRGIERRKIFKDDTDKINFLDRPGYVRVESAEIKHVLHECPVFYFAPNLTSYRGVRPR